MKYLVELASGLVSIGLVIACMKYTDPGWSFVVGMAWGAIVGFVAWRMNRAA